MPTRRRPEVSAPDVQITMSIERFADKVSLHLVGRRPAARRLQAAEYGEVILPLTVLRRLDCVLEPTKPTGARAAAAQIDGRPEVANVEPILQPRRRAAASTTRASYDFKKLLGDPDKTWPTTCRSTSPASRRQARTSSRSSTSSSRSQTLDAANLLYLVVSKFAEIDLHPDAVPNLEMGYLFEELDPAVLRAVERDGRRALHPARGHPADGQPALHRRTDDLLRSQGIVTTLLRPGLRHRRHALGRRGLPARAQPQTPRWRSSARSSTPRPTPSAAPT